MRRSKRPLCVRPNPVCPKPHRRFRFPQQGAGGQQDGYASITSDPYGYPFSTPCSSDNRICDPLPVFLKVSRIGKGRSLRAAQSIEPSHAHFLRFQSLQGHHKRDLANGNPIPSDASGNIPERLSFLLPCTEIFRNCSQ